MSRDYEIGYGKPPKHSQFKKGRSGNPLGRPKKYQSPVSVLSAPVQMKLDGKKKSVSGLEASIRKTAQNALEGRVQSIKRFIGYCETYQLIDAQDSFRPGGTVRVPASIPPGTTLDDLARKQHLEREANLPKRKLSEEEAIVRKVARERFYVRALDRNISVLDLVLLKLKERALKDRFDPALALFEKARAETHAKYQCARG